MSYLGSWKIDDNLTFPANTHLASTGAATDADAVPAYRVYEDETGTAILTGNMAKLDDANTTGFYSEQIALSAANGFEKGKAYSIYISAAVSSVTGSMNHTFQMEAEVDANVVSDKLGYNALIPGGTTLNVVTNQTNMTLNAGPGDNNALLNAVIVFTDADGDQSYRNITAYTGSTKAIVIDSAPDFTVVSGDAVEVYPVAVAATAAEIRDAILDRVLNGNHDDAGSLGLLIQAVGLAISQRTNNSNLDALLGVSDTAAYDLKKELLNIAITGEVADSIFERIKAGDDKLPSGTISDYNPATDTVPELAQGQPPAVPTYEEAAMLLYMAIRNQLDVEKIGDKKVHNDAGTVITKKALTDDGATYSEAKMVTGP